MDIRLIDANALDDQLGVSDRDIYVKDCLNEQPTITLNDLRDEIYADAVSHGLWEGTDVLCNQTDVVTNETMELLSTVTELALATTAKERKKAQEHFNEELADVVIGCFSLAGKLGIDIDAAIRRKMEINKKRPWKHGKGE